MKGISCNSNLLSDLPMIFHMQLEFLDHDFLSGSGTAAGHPQADEIFT